MKILLLTRRAWPKVGGVEKHIGEIKKVFEKKGHRVKVISEADIKYPRTKFLGLLFIWKWLFEHKKLIREADVIHVHDVFIWYLPFKFLYPHKMLITTVHGLEWDNPLRQNSIFQKQLAIKLSDKTIGIGHFLEKYIGRKFDLISYGAADLHNYKITKNKKAIVFVGRLEENTGLVKFLEWLKRNSGYKVDFCGDGNLRNECERYGEVHGFCNPNSFYEKVKLVIPGGYLAALEALNSGCDIKLFWNNKVKENYWKMSPFYKFKGEKLRKWAREQTWEKLADKYLKLYKEALNEKH